MGYLQAVPSEYGATMLALMLQGWSDRICSCSGNGSGAQCDGTASLVRSLVPLFGLGCPLVELDLRGASLAHPELLRAAGGGKVLL
jgi:hypothetical protein